MAFAVGPARFDRKQGAQAQLPVKNSSTLEEVYFDAYSDSDTESEIVLSSQPKISVSSKLSDLSALTCHNILSAILAIVGAILLVIGYHFGLTIPSTLGMAVGMLGTVCLVAPLRDEIKEYLAKKVPVGPLF